MNICDYGCGQEAIHQFKNGRWCCSINAAQCPIIREKNSEKNAGENNAMFGRKHSKITKLKIGEASKKKIFNDEYRDKLRKNMLGNKRRLGIPHTQETRDLISKKNKGRPLSEQNKMNISKALKGRVFDKKWRKKLSDSAKKKFKNPEFLKQFKKSITQKPTSIEKIIEEIIIQYGYEYVGDFSLWIDGKNPDFIKKKDKKIIEVFGNYWHEKNDEYKRYLHFKNLGYKLLVIWEHEIIKDMENVKKRILKFDYK